MVLTNYWGREKYIKFSIILVFIPKVIFEVGIFLMEKKKKQEHKKFRATNNIVYCVPGPVLSENFKKN